MKYTIKLNYAAGALGVLETYSGSMAWWFWGHAVGTGSPRSWWSFAACGLVWLLVQFAGSTVDKK
jgi:hypothetical protein